MAESCVCGSNKSYRRCCGRFLDNGERAKTPEQLMRSRYSAYALGKHGDYLLQTWFPATAGGLSAAQLSEVSCQWLRIGCAPSGSTRAHGSPSRIAGFSVVPIRWP